MKFVSFPISRTFAAVSLSLACTMPVLAQSTTGAGTDTSTGGTTGTNTGATSTQTVSDTSREKDRDYGWIGLLGLAGLLGLRRKHNDHTVTRNTTSATR
ncbi:WGxxGxxG-CTERM domain-containing protein [Noviherbaspirillum sp. L7-7A]|nr:WGxxGxxG-CTERM domain-containing protein [Noviherbaspirillum sp. L7-7A]